MNKATVGLLAAVLWSGCGGGGDSNSSKCKRPEGNFLVTYTKKSGDCGPTDDQVRALYSDGAPRAGCDESNDFIDDGCSIEAHRTCQKLAGTASIVETLSFVSDREWEGLLDIRATALDGSSCHSVYESVAVRK